MTIEDEIDKVADHPVYFGSIQDYDLKDKIKVAKKNKEIYLFNTKRISRKKFFKLLKIKDFKKESIDDFMFDIEEGYLYLLKVPLNKFANFAFNRPEIIGLSAYFLTDSVLAGMLTYIPLNLMRKYVFKGKFRHKSNYKHKKNLEMVEYSEYPDLSERIVNSFYNHSEIISTIAAAAFPAVDYFSGAYSNLGELYIQGAAIYFSSLLLTNIANPNFYKSVNFSIKN
ncbi:hypothetical protein ACFL1H_03085, partial [Nanoarchaeota archaeon]